MTNRTIPQSYYYSGQGRVMLGDRDPLTGRAVNLVEVGNCPGLSIDIATTKFEHKESMSGNRGKDISNFKEKNATVKMTLESFSKRNLVTGLYGTSAVTSTTPVVGEPQIYSASSGIVGLSRPNVSAVVVKKGATTITADQYTVDPEFGTLRFKTTPTGLVDGDAIAIDYTAGASWRVEALNQSTVIEKFFRFEGLNTNDGTEVLVQIPRLGMDPVTTLALINDELASFDLTGNILLDPFVTSGSQYFKVDYIGHPTDL